MTKILFMGLGTMGYPMAGHLKKSGYEVTVYNRTESRAKKWAKEFFGNYTNEPANEASFFDIVFACVGNDDDLKEVTSGEKGILKKMRNGSIFVDHTTASASVERELFNISKDLQIKYLDAPVSGGEKGAQEGKLTIMCGGEKTAFKEVEEVMASYSQTCRLMGKIGSGQLTKMANQIHHAVGIEIRVELIIHDAFDMGQGFRGQDDPIRAVFALADHLPPFSQFNDAGFIVSLHERTHSDRVVNSLINRSFAFI